MLGACCMQVLHTDSEFISPAALGGGYQSSNCIGRETGLESDKTTVTQLLRDVARIGLQALVFRCKPALKKKKKP